MDGGGVRGLGRRRLGCGLTGDQEEGGGGDAGAHLTFFCDAAFGLHLLGHWSRDLGVLDLPGTSPTPRSPTTGPAPRAASGW